MDITDKKTHVHFTFPISIMKELENLVEHRKRSEFVSMATKKELEKLKLLKIMEMANGSWSDEDYKEELKDEKSIIDFVDNIRKESDERLKNIYNG
jgi:metal-responsive CopG/Arc/MetJ family transcriptional regulator